MKTFFSHLLAGVILVSSLALLGCAGDVVVGTPPPPPPPPADGRVWIHGHWHYYPDGSAVWVRGHWRYY